MPINITTSNGMTRPVDEGESEANAGKNLKKSTSWISRNVERKAPPPPPKVQNSPSPDKAKTGNDHLAAIRKGVSLRKITTRKKENKPAKTTNAGVKFLSASEYIANCSWDNYKKSLVDKIIAAKGRPTDNPHLNRLMQDHAEYANKVGIVNAVVSDRDASGQVQTHQNVRKSEYEGYVLGRERNIDRNNDFKQSINSFLDKYLSELTHKAKKDNLRLKDCMKLWFNINAKVESPQSFFRENSELKLQLDKTGFDIRYFGPEDITESFVDALIRFDTNPEKINPMLEKIFSREKVEILAKEKAIEKAMNLYRDKLKKHLRM